MSIGRIAIHRAPGEIRAAALDKTGRPIRLFLERWGGMGEPARVNSFAKGRVRNASPKDRGTFFELESGEAVFVRGPTDLTEGAETGLIIMAEARHGKLARAVTTEGAAENPPAFEAWLASLPDDPPPAPEPDPDAVEQAFDEALSPRIGLAGGGEIEIARTRALTAIDVDTIGRQTKGSAAARALSVNREAVAETARQLVLRNLGGLAVIDCIAPIHAEAGQQLREIFLQSFKALSRRSVEALRPSRFGLLEAKLAWGEAPMADRLLDEAGHPTGETELLDLFRAAEREARADRTAFFSLALSPRARSAYMERKPLADRAIAEAFSGRVSVEKDPSEQSMVRRV
ncbi:ribonuclease E/G [Henriciella aquimarina]|uniref:ribonuclease E/G n=1 Tax=Henriciella aquimarina TaxID=545261 RepID=UPI0009FD50A3|nr:ribonuclease E/G [Henriciella aquimarina]